MREIGENALYATFWVALSVVLLSVTAAVLAYNVSENQTCSRPVMGNGHETFFCRDFPGKAGGGK